MKNVFSKKIINICALVFMGFFSQSFGVTTGEVEKNNDSKENVINYSKFGMEETSWLSFRDIPKLVEKYVTGKKALDYGCGAGRSTRFLKSMGFNVAGVDISPKFLNEANSVDKEIQYFLIESAKIPVIDNSYDFIFSSHVFLVIPTKEEMAKIIKEAHRVLKSDGIFIVVTGSDVMHSPEKSWLSYETKFPENYAPANGAAVKLFIKNVGVTFYDYNWSDNDYRELFMNNGFQVLEKHSPLGKDGEGYNWLSEKESSPYNIYVLKKKN